MVIRPPLEELLEQVDSKYALVLAAAKRARQLK
ncbi:MAG: DNA-directed RNA polymerase subunit omega, partial [Armatimonadota bacterium]|nr:DNA-directed RNA polymerase subunit omega [Armatimonadota bacterium]